VTDLVGLTQIAERLDVPRSTVDSWRRRGRLPQPALMIGIHPLWEWAALEPQLAKVYQAKVGAEEVS
jgi:predicted site-specific integrase-resolvase